MLDQPNERGHDTEANKEGSEKDRKSSETKPSSRRRSLLSKLFYGSRNKSKSTDKSNDTNIDDVDDGYEPEFELIRQSKLKHRNQIESPADNDSYILDLNKRLEREKVYQKSSRRTSSLQDLRSHMAELQRAKFKSPGELNGSWHTNQNYIPIPEGEHPLAVKKVKRKQDFKKAGRSPLLEQFINLHKIKFDSDTSASNSSASSSSSSTPELANSLIIPNTIDNRELRLNHWRLLAARPKRGGRESPLSSDSDLDLVNCPALCDTCSDDTSCSSVELIWTRPINNRISENNNIRSPVGYVGPDERRTSSAASVVVPEILTPLKPQQVTNRVAHRLSIFELAKPSRAKGRKFRDAQVPTPSVQWHANPLFGNYNSYDAGDEEDHVELKGAEPTVEKEQSPPNSKPVTNLSFSHESVMHRIAQVAMPWSRRREVEAPRLIEAETAPIPEGDDDVDNSDLSSLPLDLDLSLSNSSVDSIDLDEFNESTNLRASKKRWSMRVRSPFAETRRDNLYANHIANLDKRIKSNVSSIKNQLSEKISDTSKMASVLADQLITSIKDTTKEQLFSASAWGNKDRKSDTIPNSFVPSDNSSVPSSEQDLTDPNVKKAKLFSLIYKHQLQANGRPVIIKQPSASTFGKPFNGTAIAAKKSPSEKPAVPPRPKSLDRRPSRLLLQRGTQAGCGDAKEKFARSIMPGSCSTKTNSLNTLTDNGGADQQCDTTMDKQRRRSQ